MAGRRARRRPFVVALGIAFLAAAPGPPGRGPNPPKPNSIMRGTGPFASAGVVTVSWMSTLICGHARVIDVAHETLGDHRHFADLLPGRLGHLPGHLGHVLGNPSIDLTVEVLNDLRTSLGPPSLGSRHPLPILQDERVGQVRIRVGL